MRGESILRPPPRRKEEKRVADPRRDKLFKLWKKV